MNRRDWLKKAMQLAALGIAGDQLELLDRLNHSKIFSSIAYPSHKEFSLGFIITQKHVEHDWYAKYGDISNAVFDMKSKIDIQISEKIWKSNYTNGFK